MADYQEKPAQKQYLAEMGNRKAVCAAANIGVINLDATQLLAAASSPSVLYPVFNLASSGEYPMRNAMRSAHIRNDSFPIGLLLDGLPDGDKY